MKQKEDIMNPSEDYKEGFEDGARSTAEQANEIHAIELHEARADERMKATEIIQKEIAKSDKYEIAPLERIRIKLSKLK